MNEQIAAVADDRLRAYLDRTPSFLYSAGWYRDVRESTLDEFCIIGRSNVGKSSFINHALNNGNMAKVSKKPGKTNLANFFDVGPDLVWVDLPGYGYAKAPRNERERWSGLIDDFCRNRANLKGIIWLLDVRHPGTPADRDAFEWLSSLPRPVLPVLTKADKLTQQEVAKSAKEYMAIFGFRERPFCYTTEKHISREKFWAHFLAWRDTLTAGTPA